MCPRALCMAGLDWTSQPQVSSQLPCPCAPSPEHPPCARTVHHSAVPSRAHAGFQPCSLYSSVLSGALTARSSQLPSSSQPVPARRVPRARCAPRTSVVHNCLWVQELNSSSPLSQITSFSVSEDTCCVCFPCSSSLR